MILDPYDAETIDMRNLLEKVLKKVKQDPDVDASTIKPNIAYNFVKINESLSLMQEYQKQLLNQ